MGVPIVMIMNRFRPLIIAKKIVYLLTRSAFASRFQTMRNKSLFSNQSFYFFCNLHVVINCISINNMKTMVLTFSLLDLCLKMCSHHLYLYNVREIGLKLKLVRSPNITQFFLHCKKASDG